MQFKLKKETIENLEAFSQMLNKSVDQIIEEALEEYFASAQDKLLKNSIEKENAQTNLSYDEFWDGVDIWFWLKVTLWYLKYI